MSQKIKVLPYEMIFSVLGGCENFGSKVGMHLESCNADMHRLCKSQVIATENVIQRTKAAKNQTEMNGMRACNVIDAAAIMKYFAYLEEELRKPDHGIDEFTAARTLDEIRTKNLHH